MILMLGSYKIAAFFTAVCWSTRVCAGTIVVYHHRRQIEVLTILSVVLFPMIVPNIQIFKFTTTATRNNNSHNYLDIHIPHHNGPDAGFPPHTKYHAKPFYCNNYEHNNQANEI